MRTPRAVGLATTGVACLARLHLGQTNAKLAYANVQQQAPLARLPTLTCGSRLMPSRCRQLVESAGKMEAARFLCALIEAVPYRIHTVLTKNGKPFLPREWDISDGRHIFARTCRANRIEHRLAGANHLRTKGQDERLEPND